ncbi:hypothetical protein C8R45DRAFT_948183 [Mycena sanguinolenta]|nr:hypothetical protein C8R45DRAFT_948183 [Mycena sanguinolenta]
MQARRTIWGCTVRLELQNHQQNRSGGGRRRTCSFLQFVKFDGLHHRLFKRHRRRRHAVLVIRARGVRSSGFTMSRLILSPSGFAGSSNGRYPREHRIEDHAAALDVYGAPDVEALGDDNLGRGVAGGAPRGRSGQFAFGGCTCGVKLAPLAVQSRRGNAPYAQDELGEKLGGVALAEVAVRVVIWQRPGRRGRKRTATDRRPNTWRPINVLPTSFFSRNWHDGNAAAQRRRDGTARRVHADAHTTRARSEMATRAWTEVGGGSGAAGAGAGAGAGAARASAWRASGPVQQQARTLNESLYCLARSRVLGGSINSAIVNSTFLRSQFMIEFNHNQRHRAARSFPFLFDFCPQPAPWLECNFGGLWDSICFESSLSRRNLEAARLLVSRARLYRIEYYSLH